MKNMLPSAFGFVEGSGFYYGLSIIARTLSPGFIYNFKNKTNTSYESICVPDININSTGEEAHSGTCAGRRNSGDRTCRGHENTEAGRH